MDANYQLQTGQVLARYQIVRTIGEGGMGTVYEAFHPVLKKRFAIKTLLASIAQIPDARARFLREAEVAARINHPNVVRVTDVGTDGEIPYMVMEFLEGQTLGGLLAARGHLEIIETMDIMLPVLSAVAAGHAQGIVHRDLKPENIFLTQGSWGELSPKVLDFGVSKLIGDAASVALTGTMTVLGTAAYMSPEQARGAREVDHRSDQYALGLILYEMLTGTRGHPGDNPFEVLHNISTRAIVPPREYRPDCPPALEEIVIRMLAPAPEQRFPTLLDVGAALLAFASDKSRLTMGDAFRQHRATAVLPASETPSQSQAQVRPPSTPSAPSPRGTKLLPTGDELLATAGRRRRGDASTTAPVARGLRRRAPLIGVAVAGMALLGVTIWALQHKPSPSMPARNTAESSPRPSPNPEPVPPPVRTIEVAAIPAQAVISLDNGTPVSGHLHTTVPADGESHVLRVWAPGYQTKTISLGPNDEAPAQIRLDPVSETTSGEGRDRAPRNTMAAKPGKPRQNVAPSDKVPSSSKRAPSSASGAQKW
jgi:eukaryotic-like serine/threonine-protein kinase